MVYYNIIQLEFLYLMRKCIDFQQTESFIN